MSVTKLYKIITPGYASTELASNADSLGYGSLNWYTRLVRGSYNRIKKYSEYDTMDADIDVARALDIIAEEMTGNMSKKELPLELNVDNKHYKMKTATISTLQSALKTWCKVQQWESRLFGVARNTVKYGDCFFLRNKTGTFKKLIYVHPKFVNSAKVSVEDVYDVKEWEVNLNFNDANSGYGNQLLIQVTSKGSKEKATTSIPGEDIVRFSLSDEMNMEAPFGESILRAAYRTFKQKELLEDSLLIYRISRAPERRVFYIPTGKMRGNQREAHLRKIKNEMRQKKMPINRSNKDQIESIYDPQSMQEDFFFAVGADGNGARVETLPGGQGLGQLDDLQYFFSKLWRGLRIPDSYMNNMEDGGGASFTDGRVGIAYMQEIKFAQYVERLQKYLEKTLDSEFKKFLSDMKIVIDPSSFNITMPSPSNFADHRDIAINADRLSNFSNADGVEGLSKRFTQTKYLQLTPEEQALNERLKREEMGLPVDGGKEDLVKLYNPDIAEDMGFEGGVGMSGGEFAEGGEEDFGEEELDDEGNPIEGEEDIGGDEATDDTNVDTEEST